MELSMSSMECVNIKHFLIWPRGIQNITSVEFLPKMFNLNQILSRLWDTLHDNDSASVINAKGGETILETEETNKAWQAKCKAWSLFGDYIKKKKNLQRSLETIG